MGRETILNFKFYALEVENEKMPQEKDYSLKAKLLGFLS